MTAIHMNMMKTGREWGAWYGRSHGDNSPTSAWDCKTNLCIDSRCNQVLSYHRRRSNHHCILYRRKFTFSSSLRSQAKIIIIKFLNIIRIRNITGVDTTLLIFHDYVYGDRIVLHQSPGRAKVFFRKNINSLDLDAAQPIAQHKIILNFHPLFLLIFFYCGVAACVMQKLYFLVYYLYICNI